MHGYLWKTSQCWQHLESTLRCSCWMDRFIKIHNLCLNRFILIGCCCCCPTAAGWDGHWSLWSHRNIITFTYGAYRLQAYFDRTRFIVIWWFVTCKLRFRIQEFLGIVGGRSQLNVVCVVLLRANFLLKFCMFGVNDSVGVNPAFY